MSERGRQMRAARVATEVRLLTARLIVGGFSDMEIADAMCEMALVLLSPIEEEEAA